MNIQKFNALLDEIWKLQQEAAHYVAHTDFEQYEACQEQIQEKFLTLRAMVSAFNEQKVRLVGYGAKCCLLEDFTVERCSPEYCKICPLARLVTGEAP